MPSDTRNSCAIFCSHFLKTNRLLDKGFVPSEDFADFILGKNNKTVECLGKLCCILLRTHHKEVVGDPWTFFPLFSLFPASARIQFYMCSMGCSEGWSKYTANIIDSTTYQAFFVTSAAWIHLFWASSVQKRVRNERLQKSLWDTSLIILVCCWKFKQTML